MKEVKTQLVWLGTKACCVEVRLARLVQGEAACSEVDPVGVG